MLSLDGLHQHRTPRPYPFGPVSIADILVAGLRAHPERLALIDGDRTWTWTELDDAVRSIADGISPGDQIWWALGNCAEAVIGTLATFRAGGILVGMSGIPPQRAPSIEPWLTEQIGQTMVIDSPAAFDARTARGTPTVSAVNERPHIDPAAPAAVAFTSGTSGVAKAVVHSQRNLLWPGLISAELEPPTPEERIGTPLSLSILNITVLGPLSALLRGSTFVVLDRTHAVGFAEDIERFGVTRVFVVPTLLHDLVDQDVPLERLRSLDRVIVGGSGTDPRLLTAFTERFGVRPTLSYGLTEAPTGVVRESLDDPIGSGRGFPLPHIEVEIQDATGATAPTGAEGEVCIRPATSGAWAHTWTPTLGYLGDRDRNERLFANGVLHTGDLGHLDEDGALLVTGRMSNLIIRGGMNVDPIAVEHVLLSDPSVTEAVVVAIPDDRLGERVGAVIVPRSGHAIDRDRLRRAVREQISSHSVPDAIVTDTEIAKTEMGKVIRSLPPSTFDQGDSDFGDASPITTTLRTDGANVEE